MITIKNRTQENFTTVPNSLINDERLSWKAKGILIYLMSKPNDWVVRESDLIKKAKESKTAYRSGCKELEDLGYLKVSQKRSEDGTFSNSVVTIDLLPMSENLTSENLTSENHSNTNNSNTNTNNTNISKDIGNISLKEKNNNYGNKELLILKDILIRKYPVEIIGITNTRELQNLKQVCSPRKGRDEWMNPYWRDNFEKFLKEYLSITDQKYLVRSVKKLKDRVKDWRERGGVSKELEEVKRPKL